MSGEDSAVHPIEAESYRRLAADLDLSGLEEGPAAVVRRVVHATAEPALADALVVPTEAVAAGVAALHRGAPVLCDVEMVRAGLSVKAHCLLPLVDEPPPRGSTRTAVAMAQGLASYPEGAVVVVGCAPTAAEVVVEALREGRARPALVVATPVGYVGATEAKEALLEVAGSVGVPAIVLRGRRGGAAVAAAAINALARRAGVEEARRPAPALFVIGHGTRSAGGADELRRFAAAVAARRPTTPVGAGFIEFMAPGLDEALDALVATGVFEVVAVPLVLLGAGHLKDDGPMALARARRRHQGVSFRYARDFGVHPAVLEVVAERVAASGPRPEAVVVVGRGSSDPDANGDLVKAARLLADGRRLAEGEEGEGPPPLAHVEPAFVSLARPSVETALERCHRLGARRIVVVPYFLFTGLLVERIGRQAAHFAAEHPGTEVVVAPHMGVDDRLADLVWERYDEVLSGPVRMNCDGCLHRVDLPGYERLAPPSS